MSDPQTGGDQWIVPLFPLPNVVLLPKAVLPLHIFEQRYRAMVAKSLDTDRQIAMALLQPGWENDYYGRPPIEPVVCVGTILTHEKLPDRRYNILLQGHTRARLVSESGQQGDYREALVEPLADFTADEGDLLESRRRLLDAFRSPGLASTGIGRKMASLLQGSLPTSDLADLIAFNFVENIEVKQALLAERDPRIRVGTVAEWIERVAKVHRGGGHSEPSLN